MTSNQSEIRVRGNSVTVPSAWISGQRVITSGKIVCLAVVHDEELIDGQAVCDPELFISELEKSGLKADIFCFAQPLTQTTPRYRYYFEWDNAAVIPITSYADWWQRRSHDLRRDVKRSKNRGVLIKTCEFNDEFVRGIMEIYNETPIRQGRPFWHYGKDFAAVKNELSTYLDKSEFVGAYHNDELIGFLKIVYVGRLGRLMFILSKMAHRDKRPTNALIAKAVELCEVKKCSHLTYGNFTYGNGVSSSLTAFKHRNGFEQILFPKYYIPLTFKGKVCLKLKLHHGFKGIIPPWLLERARTARAKLYTGRGAASKPGAETERPQPAEAPATR